MNKLVVGIQRVDKDRKWKEELIEYITMWGGGGGLTVKQMWCMDKLLIHVYVYVV